MEEKDYGFIMRKLMKIIFIIAICAYVILLFVALGKISDEKKEIEESSWYSSETHIEKLESARKDRNVCLIVIGSLLVSYVPVMAFAQLVEDTRDNKIMNKAMLDSLRGVEKIIKSDSERAQKDLSETQKN